MTFVILGSYLVIFVLVALIGHEHDRRSSLAGRLEGSPYRASSGDEEGVVSLNPPPPSPVKRAGWWPFRSRSPASLPKRLYPSDLCPACGLLLTGLHVPAHVGRCSKARRPHLHQQCPMCDCIFCTEIVNPAWFQP